VAQHDRSSQQARDIGVLLSWLKSRIPLLASTVASRGLAGVIASQNCHVPGQGVLTKSKDGTQAQAQAMAERILSQWHKLGVLETSVAGSPGQVPTVCSASNSSRSHGGKAHDQLLFCLRLASSHGDHTGHSNRSQVAAASGFLDTWTNRKSWTPGVRGVAALSDESPEPVSSRPPGKSH